MFQKNFAIIYIQSHKILKPYLYRLFNLNSLNFEYMIMLKRLSVGVLYHSPLLSVLHVSRLCQFFSIFCDKFLSLRQGTKQTRNSAHILSSFHPLLQTPISLLTFKALFSSFKSRFLTSKRAISFLIFFRFY